MKYARQYLATATSLIAAYDGTMPLSNYLKQYFAANKKYGGKDRKHIAHFCFVYYRLANALSVVPVAEIIRIGLFICNENIEDITILFDQNWIGNWKEPIDKRIAFIKSIHSNFNVYAIFPLVNELSNNIDVNAFALSHLVQPDLFLRIRPTQKPKVLEKLQAANIGFKVLENDCLALNNNSKIDAILEVDREVVVQDYSSQRIAEFLSVIRSTSNYQLATFSIWDCCAASGGKSILTKDLFGEIDLTVTDVRPSIIQNLKNRFAKAGIRGYKSFVADITSERSLEAGHRSLVIGHREGINNQPSTTNYQLIICDAPCSGSGTWGRTPEQLSFFKEKDIAKYTQLQRQIVTNTITQLAPNGYFLYITCSVFKQENEDIIAFILQQNPLLKLIKQEILLGYDKKADSMFAALVKY